MPPLCSACIGHDHCSRAIHRIELFSLASDVFRIEPRAGDSMRGLLRNIGVTTLQTYLNVSYERFGEMTELKIDPQNRRIDATLMLHGETEPIQLSMEGYQFTHVDDETFLSFTHVHTSRQWITTLLNDLLKDRPLPIPDRAAKLLKLLLG